MEKAFISMPAKPGKNDNIGTMIAPALCDYLGDVFNANKILTVNLIHSYGDRTQYLNRYLEGINCLGINYDILLKDIDYSERIIDIVGDMLDIGIIKTGLEKVFRCDCGKVELSHDGVRKKNNASLYTIVNDKLICNCCHGVCKEYEDNILYIPIEKEKITEVIVSPSFLKKCVNGKYKEMVDTKFIISKNRNTGYSIYYGNHIYFIDVDFMWMNLFRFIDADEKILISGNKQSLKLFYINYIYSIYKRQKINFIMHPFFYNTTNTMFETNDNSYLLNKLTILFNMSWNRETCSWNEGIYSFLNKLTDCQLQYLYNIMCNVSTDIINSNQDANQKFDYILKYGTNFQRNKKTIKNFK